MGTNILFLFFGIIIGIIIMSCIASFERKNFEEEIIRSYEERKNDGRN